MSEALVLYIGDGRLSAPSRDGATVRVTYADAAATLIAEFDAIHVDWNTRDADAMEQYVRETEIAQRPELSDAAIDALIWRFWYRWK